MRVLGIAFMITAAVLAEGCRDEISTSYCRDMRDLGFCELNRNFRAKCKETCGDCEVPPTAAPKTTSPDTAAPKTPPTLTSAPVTQGPVASCGISTVPVGRVIAGQNAKEGAWPWQIAMYIGTGFACGGSLVTPEWVVTAAHCVSRYRDPRYYTIKLGAHVQTRDEPFTQIRKVTRIISHPKYGRALNYDLALMKLDRPALLNEHVRTVCLPKDDDKVPVGTKCYITGWGKIRHPGMSHSVLQQAELPIVDSESCKELNSRVVGIPITEQMVCAGHGPYDPRSGCHGDSGGPLVCQYGHGSSFVLQGAVSWGSPRCYTGDAYTVFARITSFRKWIRHHIGV